jgi:hypothetical protein
MEAETADGPKVADEAAEDRAAEADDATTESPSAATGPAEDHPAVATAGAEARSAATAAKTTKSPALKATEDVPEEHRREGADGVETAEIAVVTQERPEVESVAPTADNAEAHNHHQRHQHDRQDAVAVVVAQDAAAEAAEAEADVEDAADALKLAEKKGLLPMVGTFPEESADCVSRCTFHYLGPLINLGYKRPLRQDDLWALPEAERVDRLLAAHEAVKARVLGGGQAGGGKHAAAGARGDDAGAGAGAGASAADGSEGHRLPLGKLLWEQFRADIIGAGVFMFLQVGTQIGGPLLVREVVRAVSNPVDSDPYRGLYLAFIYFAVQLLNALFMQQHLHLNTRVGERMRALLIAIIYRKALTLRLIDMGASNHGNIMNLMSNDSQKFFDLMPNLHLLWGAPLQMALATLFLILLLGW